MTAMSEDFLFSLKALASDVRMQMLILLGSRDRMSVGEVAEHMEIGTSTVSEHLKELRRAGFITHKKEGKSVYYRLDKDVIVKRLDELKHILTCC